MNKTTLSTSTLKMPTTAILSIILHLTMVLMKRMMLQTIKTIRSVYEWLNSSHDFCGDDGDPIKWTGWQYIGYSCIACVVCVLLCINYN